MKFMKVAPIEVSLSAYDLIQAFNQWLEDSSKKDYRFSEEQYYLEQMIKIMNNQINILVDYEIKRKNEKNEK